MKKVLFFPPAYVSEKPILLDMPDTAAAVLVSAGAGAYPLDLGGNIPAPVVPVPTMSFAIPSMSVVEGDNGTKTVTNTINVNRNGASGPLTVTFIYTGTATSGADFSGPSSVIIPANASSVQHSIVVNGDVAVEADETVVISAALSGFVATAGAIVTIMNDDVTTQPSPMVVWTPEMIGVLELYDASVAGSMLNAAGTQAQPGEGVATWTSQTSNGRKAEQATAAAQPLLGVDADRSPTNVRPVTMRGSQVMPTNVNSTMDRYTIFAVMRLKAGITGSKYLIGNDDGGVYNLLQSAASAAGALRPLIAAQTFETDTTERFRSFTQNMQVAGVSFSRIQGREESLNTTGSGTGLASGKRFFLGSNSGNTAGGLVDFFSFALVAATVSRANQQRMEGYLAHRAGLASQVLEPTHPYYSNPPMVPSGTTTTLDWLESPPTVGAQQTFMGGYIELQPDSYVSSAQQSPATDGTTDIWGFPYSLINSERARLKSEMCGASNPRFRYLRLPLGFAYRGLRNIDPTSGLARNIGERFAGQNAAISDLMSNAFALGGGFMPEYWSPPPHWKTTSSYGKGSLWAGGTYARDVTLASIRTTDATQFNAQIEELTTAMVNDLEYVHQNLGPVRGFGLQNEAIQTTVDNFYGTCRYDASEYGAVLRAIIPKIRNSSILSTWNGQPNTVLLNGESFRGFSNAGITFSNSTVLSTGKTTLQEMWAQTFHEITAIAPNPDHIREQQWAWIASGRGKPTFVNEIEFFEPDLFTDAQRFARACVWQLHNLNLVGAPVVMPFIHIMKDVAIVGRGGSALGYALTKMRLPAPYGDDPASSGANDPHIGYGQFDFVTQNWNAAKFVLDNIPVGSIINKVDLPQGVTRIAAVGTMVNGKRRILVANYDNDPKTLMTTLGGGGTYTVSTYTATAAAVATGTVSGGTQQMTFQAHTAYVLTEA